jgi:uncharacterized membrane protein
MQRPTLSLAGLFLALSTAGALAKPPQYQIIDLGVVDGTTASQAFGESRDGMTAVGRALGNKGNPAYYWTASTGIVALPNLAGRQYAAANAVNNAGTVVGTSTTTVFGSGALPVMWVDGAVTQFPLPRGQTVGRVMAINDMGVAAGSIGGDTAEFAALFTSDATTVITATTANGSYMSYADGINDAGLVAGSGIDPNNAALNVGLVYDSHTGVLTDIGALPGANGALAFGISNGGYVVGSSMLYQGSGMPFIWSAKKGMVAIPLPLKTDEAIAYGVNDRGWAVGNGGGLYSVPFLYVRGKTYRLADLLPAGSGWDLLHNTSSSAQAITNRGTIVGTAVYLGQTHGYKMMLVKGNEAGRP